MAGDRSPRMVLWVLVALALGFLLGIMFRRAYYPTLEEKAEDAARDLERAARRFNR